MEWTVFLPNLILRAKYGKSRVDFSMYHMWFLFVRKTGKTAPGTLPFLLCFQCGRPSTPHQPHGTNRVQSDQKHAIFEIVGTKQLLYRNHIGSAKKMSRRKRQRPWHADRPGQSCPPVSRQLFKEGSPVRNPATGTGDRRFHNLFWISVPVAVGQGGEGWNGYCRHWDGRYLVL